MKSIPKAYTLQFMMILLAKTAETTAFQQRLRFEGIFLKTVA